MRSVLYILYTLNFLSGVAGKVKVQAPDIDICPWSRPSAQKLRHPACASPDLVRRLIAPELLLSSSSSSSSSSPSWTGPEHCTNGTCLFSHAAQNGGISLVTSPLHARIIQSYAVVADGGADPPPYRVAEMEGKGLGLRANRTIPKGEVLMVRAPSLMAQTDALVEFEAGTRDQLYDVAVARLPNDRRDAFMKQMGRGVHEKIETNCFRIFVHGAGDKGTSHLGCYPDIARFNHDCRPNVHYRVNNMTMTTVAARDIEPGEELSISYVDVFLPSTERKERIRRWGFECTCALCQAPKNETVASDTRLRRIDQLKSDLNDFSELKVTAETGVEFTRLHEEEGLYAHLGSAYTRAALNFALFGDEERARKYAQKAAEEMSIEMGPESGDARAMRNLADNPRAHWTWGKRRKGER
ncbi:hypothetical protein F5Y19DRAFT_471041 [Xylariaceae sp. FL1651]|nr:hypothetical protein F5Y19DRAFT_471041 [Xylariaceae sp. FL1651]